MTPALHAIAQWTALRVVDSLIEGSLVGLFAAVVLHGRRHGAGERFAVSFSALMAMAVIPFLGGSSHSGVSHAAVTVPESWAISFCLAWALVAGFFLFRLGNALWHLRALRQTCESVNQQDLDPILQETLRRHGGHRAFELCTSDEVRVPTAIGVLKPAIVIPRWVLQELSAAELNQILLHEIAHLRRWDDWTNLAQQLVRAVFFFHPAVWWIEKRVALEREMACDDAVLAETPSRRAYAECLAHLAEKSFVRRNVALAQAALGKVRQTSLRVARILSAERSTAPMRSWKPAVSVMAGLAIVCGIVASRAPQFIAFQDESPNRVVAVAAPANRMRGMTAPVSPVDMLRPRAPVAPVVQARLNTDVTRHSSRVPALAKAHPRSLVHFTNHQASSVPMIETMFVVIETRDSAAGENSQTPPQIYQIQMWRVLVLHPAADPEVKPPQKQT